MSSSNASLAAAGPLPRIAPEAEPSAAARVTKALDIACQYSGGIEYGDGPNAELLSWGDIRDVIDQLLAARHELECLRHQVGQLEYPCSPHCEGYLRELAMRNGGSRP